MVQQCVFPMAGYRAQSFEDAEFLASISAKITHSYSKSLKEQLLLLEVFRALLIVLESLIKTNKKTIIDYVSKFYELDFTLDSIRDNYRFDVSYESSVPYAVKAFLEGESFEEVLALAICGESDTIAGSLVEVIYPIPEGNCDKLLKRLNYNVISHLAGVIDFMIDARNKSIDYRTS